MMEWLGQRGATAFVTGLILTVLYFVAVAMGRNPLELPVDADGNVFSPDTLLTLLAPIVALIATFGYFVKTITDRIASGELTPGNIGALLGLREFWMHIVNTVFAGLTMFNLRFWTDEQQATIADVVVTLIMGLIATLQGSYANRPAGQYARQSVQLVKEVSEAESVPESGTRQYQQP